MFGLLGVPCVPGHFLCKEFTAWSCRPFSCRYNKPVISCDFLPCEYCPAKCEESDRGFEEPCQLPELLNVRVHRVLPKDRIARTIASHKHITDQYTNVCHVVKTLERETVHGPGQIALGAIYYAKERKLHELLIIDPLAKDPLCSLNRDHRPIGC